MKSVLIVKERGEEEGGDKFEEDRSFRPKSVDRRRSISILGLSFSPMVRVPGHSSADRSAAGRGAGGRERVKQYQLQPDGSEGKITELDFPRVRIFCTLST